MFFPSVHRVCEGLFLARSPLSVKFFFSSEICWMQNDGFGVFVRIVSVKNILFISAENDRPITKQKKAQPK